MYNLRVKFEDVSVRQAEFSPNLPRLNLDPCLYKGIYTVKIIPRASIVVELYTLLLPIV